MASVLTLKVLPVCLGVQGVAMEESRNVFWQLQLLQDEFAGLVHAVLRQPEVSMCVCALGEPRILMGRSIIHCSYTVVILLYDY